MTARFVAGAALLASVFVAIFVACGMTEGWGVAAGSFALAGVIVLVVASAMHLMFGGDQ